MLIESGSEATCLRLKDSLNLKHRPPLKKIHHVCESILSGPIRYKLEFMSLKRIVSESQSAQRLCLWFYWFRLHWRLQD